MKNRPIFKDVELKEEDIAKAIESIYEGANLLVDKYIDSIDSTKIYQYTQDHKGMITAYVFIVKGQSKAKFLLIKKFKDNKEVEDSLKQRFKDGYSFVIG